jgi:predicted ribosome quality control (RQC) complex YloA/Tae2 family protein
VQDWDVEGEVQDVELVLSDEYATAQEEADALFAAARKMKRGSAVVGELIVETENSLRFLEEAKGDLEHVFGRVSSSSGGGDDGDDGGDANVNVEDYLSMILHRLERSSKQTGFYLLPLSNNQESSNKHNQHPKKQSSPQSSQQHTCRKFHSPGGCIVLVGRNRRDNESICFQISKANDIWMHARGCPGAHVLIQVRRGSPKPTDQCLQYAANLAAFYSEFRTERKVDVTSASPKHLLKPRGAPLGAVKIRQEMNTWTGYPMDVEEELKVARERSGLVSSWDESTGLRSFGGKAKNRKRTTENVKQLVAKKRAEKRAKKKRRQGGGGGGDESSNQNEM